MRGLLAFLFGGAAVVAASSMAKKKGDMKMASGGGVGSWDDSGGVGDVLEVKDGEDTFYLTYIDPTHFYLSNSRDFKGSAYHVGQFNSRPFYSQIKSWLGAMKGKMASGGGVGSYRNHKVGDMVEVWQFGGRSKIKKIVGFEDKEHNHYILEDEKGNRSHTPKKYIANLSGEYPFMASGGGVEGKVGDLVKIVPDHESIYTNTKGSIFKIMPDGKTYEIKIKRKGGNEYVKFDRSELFFLGQMAKGGGVGSWAKEIEVVALSQSGTRGYSIHDTMTNRRAINTDGSYEFDDGEVSEIIGEKNMDDFYDGKSKFKPKKKLNFDVFS